MNRKTINHYDDVTPLQVEPLTDDEQMRGDVNRKMMNDDQRPGARARVFAATIRSVDRRSEWAAKAIR